MDSVLFERLAKSVCMGIGIGCTKCPFNGFREKYDAPSCAEAWRAYQKDAEILLATWIGRTEYVKTLGAQESQKALETRREILQAAERCVCGGREKDYGSAEDNFGTVGRLWAAYLKAAHPSLELAENVITPVDVAAMLGLLKLARAAGNPKHMDNWVDLAGYAALGGEIAGKGKG